MERHPGILLWSHRSNLDNLVLTAAMQEKGLPPAHIFAGINMAFGPMGAILRRAGVIFIRRSTSDDPLYKYVLKEYVGYVLEKRFNLSWSIEGTRSRTGKMLPPRLGLLSYAADAYLQGRVDDIVLLPVSITFDQLHEIAEYADYARGGAEETRGVRLAVRLHQGPGRPPLRQGLRALRRAGVAEQLPRSSWRNYRGRSRRAAAGAAEDGVRGGVADQPGHAGHRDGTGQHRLAGHAGGGPDVRPDPARAWPTPCRIWTAGRCPGQPARGRCRRRSRCGRH